MTSERVSGFLTCRTAAYMDLGVFYEVIVPLMEMRGAATICISTPISSWNFYTELTELRDDRGELLFNVIKVGIVCHRCLGTDQEDMCTHPSADKPDWKLETSEKMRAIYGHRKTLLMREVMGKVTDAENLAFEVRDLKAFFAAKPVAEPHSPVTRVFVAVDPTGGAGEESGTGSETAVVSFFFDGMNVVVRSKSLQMETFFCVWKGGRRTCICRKARLLSEDASGRGLPASLSSRTFRRKVQDSRPCLPSPRDMSG